MLSLHGSPISNYYNKVKLALLEKGVPFTEVATSLTPQDEATLQMSPLGKIPFVRTPEGQSLCESQVILEWIESRWPVPPLLPSDALAAAKVRELVTFIDWHVEMAARQLYGAAFFGAPPLSEGNAARVRKELEHKLGGFKRLAKFAPFVAGDTFTMADCSAFNSLPLASFASKLVYGEDLVAAAGIELKPYLKLVGERPAAQKVSADRKDALAKVKQP